MLSKLRTSSILMKGIYKKRSDKEINSFPKVRNKANISTLTTIIQHYIVGSSYSKTREIKKADIKIFICKYQIIYVKKNPMESMKMLPVVSLAKLYNKDQYTKISTVYLYASNEQ